MIPLPFFRRRSAAVIDTRKRQPVVVMKPDGTEMTRAEVTAVQSDLMGPVAPAVLDGRNVTGPFIATGVPALFSSIQ